MLTRYQEYSSVFLNGKPCARQLHASRYLLQHNNSMANNTLSVHPSHLERLSNGLRFHTSLLLLEFILHPNLVNVPTP